MNKKDRRRYESNVTVRKFYRLDRPELFVSDVAKAVTTEHDEVTTTLDRHFADESSGRAEAHEWTVARTQLRVAIRAALDAIHGVGTLLPREGDPNAERFPEVVFASDRSLLADAKAILARAQPAADELVKHGLQASVLADLPGQIEAFDRAIEKQRTGRQSAMAANAAVRELLGRASVLQKKMNTLLRVGPKQAAETRRIWRDARHVGPRREPKPAAAAASEGPKTDKVA